MASPTQESTPGRVTVSVNPTGLSSGTYTGMVHLSASGLAETNVPVTFNVTSTGCREDCGGGTTSTMHAQPYVYDTSWSGLLAAMWADHFGEPTSTSLTTHDPGLVLSKGTGAPTGSIAGAHIRNVTGSLTELGYDYHLGGQCTTTSPRFIVVTTDNITHVVGGCSNGTITAASALGWKRVRFNLTDATQTSPVITPGEQVSSITLALDQGPETDSTAGGFDLIDNIDVNGTFVGKRSTSSTSDYSENR